MTENQATTATTQAFNAQYNAYQTMYRCAAVLFLAGLLSRLPVPVFDGYLGPQFIRHHLINLTDVVLFGTMLNQHLLKPSTKLL